MNDTEWPDFMHGIEGHEPVICGSLPYPHDDPPIIEGGYTGMPKRRRCKLHFDCSKEIQQQEGWMYPDPSREWCTELHYQQSLTPDSKGNIP